MRKPVLLFDFDNTITKGDVLDAVIARFAVSDEWREWEDAWQEGRISAQLCLERQIATLRVTAAQLLAYIADVAIDRHFPAIAHWADANDVELLILSDNFSTLIWEILRRHGLQRLPVFANELVFSGDRPEARFPLLDPNCKRCAHCKGQHLPRYEGRIRIFVGDGLSDLCAAVQADIVFAKDSLADALQDRGVAFRPFTALDQVLEFLRTHYGAASDSEQAFAPTAHMGQGAVEMFAGIKEPLLCTDAIPEGGASQC